MIVRAIDSNGDFTFGKGRNNYKNDLLAVEQNIKTRLQCVLGDCFFDSTAGIDWFNYLGSKNQIGLKLAISSTILNTQYVTGILELNSIYDPATRNLSVSYKVQTSYGEATDTFIYSGGVNA